MAGVEYVFTVVASKGSDDEAEAWAQPRSDNASCVVSTSALALPQVSINPKVICATGGTVEAGHFVAGGTDVNRLRLYRGSAI